MSSEESTSGPSTMRRRTTLKLVPTEDGKVEIVVTDIDDDDDILEEDEDEESEDIQYFSYKTPTPTPKTPAPESSTTETLASETKQIDKIPEDSKSPKSKFDPNDKRFYVE